MTIPVTILAGFLGAGKTTLLNFILRGDHGLRVAVLVNDFGAINIDTQLIVGMQEEMINLSNGCICCTIRGDLLNATVKLVERSDPPEYIIIETSGVSDPIEVARTFLAPELRSRAVVDSILTVIDAEQLSTLQGENAVLAMDQIGVADMIILNKVDLVTPQALEKVKKEWIREVSPQARIIETSYCCIPLELVLGVGRYQPEKLAARGREIHIHQDNEDHPDHEHHAHDLIFQTWSWSSDQALSMKAIQKAIENLPISIYRAKGIVYLADQPEKRGILQVVGKRAQVEIGEEWGQESPRSQIVVIGSAVDAAELQRRFEGCIAASQGDRLVDRVFSWLRR